MSGPAEGKHKIRINAYIHEKGKSLARITHIDLEGKISGIIKPGEGTPNFMVFSRDVRNECISEHLKIFQDFLCRRILLNFPHPKNKFACFLIILVSYFLQSKK